MKKVLWWIGVVLLNIVALPVAVMPVGGLFFLLASALAGLVLLVEWMVGLPGFGYSALAASFLGYALWVYLAGALLTLAVMTTFVYQNCCVGVSSFGGHIGSHTDHHGEVVLTAIFWPYRLYVFDRNWSGWGLGWLPAFLMAIEYWFVTRWKGETLTVYDLQAGTVESARITPETAPEVLKTEISRLLGK